MPSHLQGGLQCLWSNLKKRGCCCPRAREPGFWTEARAARCGASRQRDNSEIKLGNTLVITAGGGPGLPFTHQKYRACFNTHPSVPFGQAKGSTTSNSPSSARHKGSQAACKSCTPSSYPCTKAGTLFCLASVFSLASPHSPRAGYGEWQHELSA